MSSPTLELTNNPCKFCNMNPSDGVPICGNLDEGDCTCITNDGDGFSIEHWGTYECLYSEKINYCPMCGRKLKEEIK